jgi:hypothetical protein
VLTGLTRRTVAEMSGSALGTPQEIDGYIETALAG